MKEKIKHYPRGQMCINCENVLDNCSDMKFDEMTRIAKPDDDGWVEVRCNNYNKIKQSE